MAAPQRAGADITGKVFFLLPNATTPRYTNYDAPEFIAAMAEYAPNVEVVVLNAEGDPQKQVQQAETAVSQGALAIVLTAADPNLSSGVLAAAAEGNVPVIAYEHEALGGPVAYFVVFSPYDAGRQAGRVLRLADRRRRAHRRRCGSPGCTATPATTTTTRCCAARTRSCSR